MIASREIWFWHCTSSVTCVRPSCSSNGNEKTSAMLARVAGQATPATTLLARQKVTHRVHAYAHDPKAASYGT